MTLHRDLADANLHEPKGVAGASADTVYVANGSGSGVWKKVGASSVDTSTILNANLSTQTLEFVDIGTAGSKYLPIGQACTIPRIDVVISGSTTATAATVFTFRNDAGTSMGTISIPSGSAAGYLASLSPVSNNTFTVGQKLQVDTDGGTSSTSDLTISVTIRWT